MDEKESGECMKETTATTIMATMSREINGDEIEKATEKKFQVQTHRCFNVRDMRNTVWQKSEP